MFGRAYLRGASSIEKLSRHERQIERSLTKATRELDLLQYSRIMNMHPFYARNILAFPAPGNVQRKEEGSSIGQARVNDYAILQNKPNF